MTALLLAEEIFLLTHKEDSGKASGTLALDNGLAGALLLDLAAEELVAADGKAITAVAGTASHPLLALAHAELLRSDKPRSAQHWVNRLPTSLKHLGSQVGQSLAERGVLAEQRRKVLGIFPTTTWPEVDPKPERELRHRLTRVLVEGAEPDPHTALLISLLSPLGLVRGLVDKEHRKHAESRAKDIAKENAASAATSAAVSRSVQAVQAAIVVAVLMPAIATTSS
jgi:Golgi phosphoprotein 3 (GPP34)